MATVPVPHTFVAGDDATSAVMQTLTDAILYLLGSITSSGSRKAFCQLRQTVAQSITTNTWQAVNFDAEDVDYDNSHSTVTNTDRFTAATPGWHSVAGGASFAGNVTGNRGCRYTVNGAAVDGSESVIPAANAAGFPTGVPGRRMWIFLNAGDILRLEAFQTSGAALNTNTIGDSRCYLSAELRSN